MLTAVDGWRVAGGFNNVLKVERAISCGLLRNLPVDTASVQNFQLCLNWDCCHAGCGLFFQGVGV